jgi:hypothetical protein
MVQPVLNTQNIALTFKKEEWTKFVSTGAYSDVTVLYGERKAPLHRIILASCSGYFKSTFEHLPTETVDLTGSNFSEYTIQIVLDSCYGLVNKNDLLTELRMGRIDISELYEASAYFQCQDLIDELLNLLNVDLCEGATFPAQIPILVHSFRRFFVESPDHDPEIFPIVGCTFALFDQFKSNLKDLKSTLKDLPLFFVKEVFSQECYYVLEEERLDIMIEAFKERKETFPDEELTFKEMLGYFDLDRLPLNKTLKLLEYSIVKNSVKDVVLAETYPSFQFKHSQKECTIRCYDLDFHFVKRPENNHYDNSFGLDMKYTPSKGPPIVPSFKVFYNMRDPYYSSANSNRCVTFPGNQTSEEIRNAYLTKGGVFKTEIGTSFYDSCLIVFLEPGKLM